MFDLFSLFQQITGGLPGQTLQLDLLSNSKEGVKIFLVNICLPKVEEVKNWIEIFWLKPPEVDPGVRVFAFLENFLKEWTWRSQDDFVSLNLLAILTDQSDISELFVFSKFPKSRIDIFLESIPLQTSYRQGGTSWWLIDSESATK